MEKLEDRERKLLDEIAKLEFYKAKCVDSKNELAGIQAKKDSALALGINTTNGQIVNKSVAESLRINSN